jgi:hypothetical protein
MAESMKIAKQRQKNFVYCDPSGKEITTAQVTEVLECLLEDNPKKWKGGSGDASLTCKSSNWESTLGFMFRATYGFVLTYSSESKSGSEFFYSSSGQAKGIPVSLFVGGDFFNFDQSMFVSENHLCSAVEQFMTTEGTCPSCIKWTRSPPPLPDELLYGKKY